MDPEVYKRFISHVLSDLAERRTQTGARLARGRRRQEKVSGVTRPVFVRGEHICYQGKVRFRDSDASLRLMLAVTAAEMLEEIESGPGRGLNSAACVRVADHLLNIACDRLKAKFLVGKRGRKPAKRASPKEITASQSPSRTDMPLCRTNDRLSQLDAMIEAREQRWKQDSP